jgi:hypothetical protein
MVLRAVAPTRAAEATYDAAVKATQASIQDMQDAYTAGWHSNDLAEVLKNLRGPDGLYRAERLIPIPLEDSRLPPERRSMFWMHENIEQFLADPQVQEALVLWGNARADELEEQLADFADLPSAVRGNLQQALIVPLKSGDAKRIAGVIRAIIAES